MTNELIDNVCRNYRILYTVKDCEKIIFPIGGTQQARLVMAAIEEIFGDTDEKLQLADELVVLYHFQKKNAEWRNLEEEEGSSTSSGNLSSTSSSSSLTSECVDSLSMLKKALGVFSEQEDSD